MQPLDRYPLVYEKPPNSRCNVCLNVRALTEDHVPPRSCLEELRVDLEPFERRLRARAPRLALSQRPALQDDLRFVQFGPGEPLRPLVGNDGEAGSVVARSPLVVGDRWIVRVNAGDVIRSLFGHLLAAATDDADSVPQREMRSYVTGQQEAPGSSTRVLYWLHPHEQFGLLTGVAMPAVRGRNRGTGIFSIIKVPPLAFMVTNLEEYEGLPRLDLLANGRLAEVRVWKGLRRDPDWPERVDEGNFLMGGRSLQDAVTARPRPRRSR